MEGQPLLEPTQGVKKHSTIAEHDQIIRIKCEGALEVFCGINEFIIIGCDPTQGGVRPRLVWVERQRFLLRCARTRVAFAVRQQPHICLPYKIDRQPVPGRGIARINLKHLL